MKTLITFLLLICGLSATAQICHVKSRPLKVYERPGTDQKNLALLPPGQQVQLIPNTEKNGWVKIHYSETTGYVTKSELSCEETKPVPVSIPPVPVSKVWVCLGGSAYAYHSNNNCSGLNRCKAKITTVSEKDAKDLYSRRPCKMCY